MMLRWCVFFRVLIVIVLDSIATADGTGLFGSLNSGVIMTLP